MSISKSVSAREKWWADQYVELEELERQGRSYLLYRKVSQLTKDRKKKRSVQITGIHNKGMF